MGTHGSNTPAWSTPAVVDASRAVARAAGGDVLAAFVDESAAHEGEGARVPAYVGIGCTNCRRGARRGAGRRGWMGGCGRRRTGGRRGGCWGEGRRGEAERWGGECGEGVSPRGTRQWACSLLVCALLVEGPLLAQILDLEESCCLRYGPLSDRCPSVFACEVVVGGGLVLGWAIVDCFSEPRE